MARPENEPSTPFAQRLREVRRALNFNERKQFAEHLGIPASTLGAYETGIREPTVSVIEVYKTILGGSLDWLLTGQEEMFSDPTLVAKLAPSVVPDLLERIYKLVDEVNKQHNYKLSPAQTSHQAAELYNDLIARITDITDTEEIEAIIPQLRHLYSKRLTKSASEKSSSNVAWSSSNSKIRSENLFCFSYFFARISLLFPHSLPNSSRPVFWAFEAFFKTLSKLLPIFSPFIPKPRGL